MTTFSAGIPLASGAYFQCTSIVCGYFAGCTSGGISLRTLMSNSLSERLVVLTSQPMLGPLFTEAGVAAMTADAINAAQTATAIRFMRMIPFMKAGPGAECRFYR